MSAQPETKSKPFVSADIRRILDETVPSFQATSVADTNLGFGFLFYGFARLLRPKLTVVIGSKGGFSPVLFGLGAAQNAGCGVAEVGFQNTSLVETETLPQVHFIDPSYSLARGDTGHWYGEGRWDNLDNVVSLWKSFGIEQTVTHFKLRSEEYVIQVVEGQTIDLLYIDGDHSYEGIKGDLERFHPLLSPNAIVLAHDVDPACTEARGYDVLRDLDPALYQFVRLPIFPGLAVMRKRQHGEEV